MSDLRDALTEYLNETEAADEGTSEFRRLMDELAEDLGDLTPEE